jgi:hypothetical protein
MVVWDESFSLCRGGRRRGSRERERRQETASTRVQQMSTATTLRVDRYIQTLAADADGLREVAGKDRTRPACRCGRDEEVRWAPRLVWCSECRALVGTVVEGTAYLPDRPPGEQSRRAPHLGWLQHGRPVRTAVASPVGSIIHDGRGTFSGGALDYNDSLFPFAAKAS